MSGTKFGGLTLLLFVTVPQNAVGMVSPSSKQSQGLDPIGMAMRITTPEALMRFFCTMVPV